MDSTPARVGRECGESASDVHIVASTRVSLTVGFREQKLCKALVRLVRNPGLLL